MIVYCITNKINGKRYIGVTSLSLHRRWATHRQRARNGCREALYCAMRKYGIENFVIEPFASVLTDLETKVLFQVEKEIVAQENTVTPKGYNMLPGGNGGSGAHLRGKPLSEEHRAKLRAAWARNPARKEAQIRRQKGVPMSAEAKRRMWENKSPEQKAAHIDRLRKRNAVINTKEFRQACVKRWRENSQYGGLQ